jgi:hypothetical protein
MSDGWHKGDVWEPLLNVTDPETGEPLDAPSIGVRIRRPDDSTYTTGATKVDIGVFRPSIELTQVGNWIAVAETPGPYKGVGEEAIYAQPTGA